jgi:hypothetical protein
MNIIYTKVVDNYVKDMPFFEGEDPSVVMELSLCMERAFMGPEEDVVRSGDIGDEMYFILEGFVEVLIDVKDSKVPKKVAEMGKGKFFGEMVIILIKCFFFFSFFCVGVLRFSALPLLSLQK